MLSVSGRTSTQILSDLRTVSSARGGGIVVRVTCHPPYIRELAIAKWLVIPDAMSYSMQNIE